MRDLRLNFGPVEVDFEVGEVVFGGLEGAEFGAGGEEGLEDGEAGLPVIAFVSEET